MAKSKSIPRSNGTGWFDETEAEAFAKEAAELSFDPHLLTSSILTFGKALTGSNLYDYQEEPAYRIIYSVITMEGAGITNINCRQSGKSEYVAFVMDTLCVILPILAKFIKDLEQFRQGVKIGLFAPQSEQVANTYNRALHLLTSEQTQQILSDPEIATGLTSAVRLSFTNGSYVKGQVISKNSKIESQTYHVIFIEEAQDADSFIVEKSITPMAAATNGTIIKVGTTGTTKNAFFQEIQLNKQASRKVKDSRLVFHYENDYRKVISSKRKQYNLDNNRFHLNYEKFVLKELNRLGADSDAFRLSYALIWALDSGMFITDKEWETMTNKKKGFPQRIPMDWHIVAGLDIGKSIASTVITIGRVYHREEDTFGYEEPMKEVIGWVELHGEDYETQHQIILETLVDYNVQVLYADYTGVGKPVVDRLMWAVGDNLVIVPYTFSRPSKSEMWQNLRQDIQKRRIVIPARPEIKATREYKNCEDQFKGMQKYYEGSYLVAEKSDGYLDDYVDSMGLMALAGNHALPPEIEDDEENPLLLGMSTAIHKARGAHW